MFKRNDSRAFVLGILAALLACSSLGASSTLNFPRLSFDPATFTGVAIANPTGGEALVTLTAYGAEGQLLEVSPNPAQIMVPANQQVSLLTNEIFPGGTPDPSTVAWFQAVSETDGLTGFFLFVDNTVRELDGADLPLEAQNLVFNQVLVDTTHSTELNIINPGSAVVSLQVELVTDPTPITRNLTLAPKGAARLDAASFFGVGQVAPGAYVKATSDGTIAGFEFVRTATGDLLGLNAQSQTDQLLNLYFPQVAVLGPWRTELGLVNYSSQPVIVTLSIFKPEGVLFDSADLLNNPVTRSLAAGESLVLDVETLFGFAGSEPLEGWMQVEATVESINGFISYGIPGTGSVASVTASVEGGRRAIFSHIATVNDLFTGVALLNSGQLLTNVRILAMTPSNQVLGSFDTVLHPRQRISKLIDELIPAASGQDGGIIWVKSDLPIHLTSIFGNSGTLANIPPQQAPEGYLPDVSIPAFSIAPALAVMQPSQSQIFQVSNSPGTLEWSINGVPGGLPEEGTITSQGLYSAPQTVPDPRLVTVVAQADGQAAGASVDVLEKESLLTSLSVVQSVVYLGSLQRLYTAELNLLGGPAGAGSQPLDAAPAQEGGASEIFETVAGELKVSIASFANEEVSKMIGFTATSGQEFLLLATRDSGKIIRLDPDTRIPQEVASGLNQPGSMVIDPVTGDLLVAEADRVSLVPREDLEAGLSQAVRLPGDSPRRQVAGLTNEGADGIAVNRCNGNVFVSKRATGEIFEFVRRTGQVRRLFSGLQGPTGLLAVYRGRVACPDSFHLLVIEQDTDRILLVLAREGRVRPWLAARQSTDLTFLPAGSPFSTRESILLTETVEEEQVEQRRLSAVRVPDLYRGAPDNPRPEHREDPEPEPIPSSYQLTIRHTGPNTGQVDVYPTGETCGSPGPCTFSVEPGTFLTLSATAPVPSTPGSFSNGTGSAGECGASTCTFTIRSDSEVTVNWDQGRGPFPALDVSFAGAGSGTVFANAVPCSPPGCGSATAYVSGSQVTLFARAAEGSRFVGFTGDCMSDSAICRFPITGDAQVTAQFGLSNAASPDPLNRSAVVEFSTTVQGSETLSCSEGTWSETFTASLTFQGDLLEGMDRSVISGSLGGRFVGQCTSSGTLSCPSGPQETCSIQGGFSMVRVSAGASSQMPDLSGNWAMSVKGVESCSGSDGSESETFSETLLVGLQQSGESFSGTATEIEGDLDGDNTEFPPGCTETCSGAGCEDRLVFPVSGTVTPVP